MMKIKLIDHTLNHKKPAKGYEPYITVFLYTALAVEQKAISTLGDILILEKFTFELNEYNNKKYIQGKMSKS